MSIAVNFATVNFGGIVQINHRSGFSLIEYYSIIRLIKVRATDNSIIFNINCIHEGEGGG